MYGPISARDKGRRRLEAAEDGRNDGDGSSEDQGDGEERRAAETWKARAAGFSELGRRAARLVSGRTMGLRRFCILEGVSWAAFPAVFQVLEAEEGGAAVSD